MKKKIISMVPNRFFEMSLNLIDTVDRHLGAYIRGQIAVTSSGRQSIGVGFSVENVRLGL